MTVDRRIAALHELVANTTLHYPDGPGLEIVTNRQNKVAHVLIRVSGVGIARAVLLSIEQIDELIREAQAVRADLVKLSAPPSIPIPKIP